MYIFSNANYENDEYEKKIDSNKCVNYEIIGNNKHLTSFIADIDNRCTKINSYTWLTKNRECQIIITKGGFVQVNNVGVILPKEQYSTLEFTQHDPGEVVFQDVLHKKK